MKLLLKKMLAVAAVAISATACATPINVGGVVWDPDRADNPKDFSANTSAIMQFQNEVGGIHGYGLLNAINGVTANSDYCPGCQLALTYGGFNLITGNAVQRTYSGGWANVYVLSGSSVVSDINNTNEATISANGALFLTLVGHEINGVSLTGISTFENLVLKTATGTGQYDVVNESHGETALVGLANKYFDTNAMVDASDFTSSVSFTSFNTTNRSAFGSGTFTGDSMAIPEPGSFALMGLGMLGLIGTRSTRKQKAK